MNYQKPVYQTKLVKKPFWVHLVVANAYTDDPYFYHIREQVGTTTCHHKFWSCKCITGMTWDCDGTGLCTEAGGCHEYFQAHPSKIVAQPVIQFVGGLAPMDTNKFCPACGMKQITPPTTLKDL